MRKNYYTGLIVDMDEPDQPSPPFKGAGWEVSFVKERHHPPRMRNGLEVVIHARSWASAQRALNLILSSIILYSGDPPLFDMPFIAHNSEEPKFHNPLFRRGISEMSMNTPGIPLACAIAAKASRRQKWVYALAKYKFSISLYGVFLIDLEPSHAPHLSVSSFPDDHVMFSYAIVSAYSVVEDLGLEIRASQKKPSRINGKWNPPVKEDLEKRLEKAGIDINETILWTVPGPKRKTEKRREIPVFNKAPWARGPIRDSEIALVDAIAYSDWLRDCVASHGFKDLTKILSPYDVVNVQHLARRLLLEVLGFWRYHEKTGNILTRQSSGRGKPRR